MAYIFVGIRMHLEALRAQGAAFVEGKAYWREGAEVFEFAPLGENYSYWRCRGRSPAAEFTAAHPDVQFGERASLAGSWDSEGLNTRFHETLDKVTRSERAALAVYLSFNDENILNHAGRSREEMAEDGDAPPPTVEVLQLAALIFIEQQVDVMLEDLSDYTAKERGAYEDALERALRIFQERGLEVRRPRPEDKEEDAADEQQQ